MAVETVEYSRIERSRAGQEGRINTGELGSEKGGAWGTANDDMVMWQLKKQSMVELRETEWSEKKQLRQESWGVRRKVLKS